MSKITFKQLGPGLLFAGAAIGVSHLVQSTRAGADFGMGLVWALLLIHLIKYPFFQFGPRYAAATGKSLLYGYLRLGKGVLLFYFLISLASMFTIQAAVTIVTASLASYLFGLDMGLVSWSIIITFICAILLVVGRYALLDRLMKIIIITLTLSTFFAVIVAFVDSTKAIQLDQVLPDDATGIAFLIAFMGWMPAPLDISIWHSLWSLEKNKEEKISQKTAIFDFNIGYAGTIIVGICFISLGALIMYHSGISFSNSGSVFAEQLVKMYTSSLGQWSFWVIGIAALTTMLSTTLTTLDASPRSMAQTLQLLTGKTQKYGYRFWLLLLILGTCTILLFLTSEMGSLVQLATVLSFLTAPFYAIANYLVITGADVPAQAKPKLALRIASYIGIVGLVGFGIWYLFTL